MHSASDYIGKYGLASYMELLKLKKMYLELTPEEISGIDDSFKDFKDRNEGSNVFELFRKKDNPLGDKSLNPRELNEDSNKSIYVRNKLGGIEFNTRIFSETSKRADQVIQSRLLEKQRGL